MTVTSSTMPNPRARFTPEFVATRTPASRSCKWPESRRRRSGPRAWDVIPCECCKQFMWEAGPPGSGQASPKVAALEDRRREGQGGARVEAAVEGGDPRVAGHCQPVDHLAVERERTEIRQDVPDRRRDPLVRR